MRKLHIAPKSAWQLERLLLSHGIWYYNSRVLASIFCVNGGLLVVVVRFICNESATDEDNLVRLAAGRRSQRESDCPTALAVPG